MARKTIIVTGASRGIGLAIAKKLLSEDANVVVQARDAEALKKLQDEYHDQVRILSGDMSNLDLPQRVVDLAVKEFGDLNGIIFNHGTMDPVCKIENTDIQEWRKLFDVNFFSAVAFAKAALPILRKNSGCILLTSSGVSTGAYSSWGAYGASKAAMNQLAAQIACEEPDITTLSVRPGVVDTDMQRNLREVHSAVMAKKDNEKFIGLYESNQLLRPEQPGDVMAKIALDPPKALNGKYVNWEAVELEKYQEKSFLG